MQKETRSLSDITTNEGAEELHRLQAVFQEDANLYAWGLEHFILVVLPGTAQRLAA